MMSRVISSRLITAVPLVLLSTSIAQAEEKWVSCPFQFPNPSMNYTYVFVFDDQTNFMARYDNGRLKELDDYKITTLSLSGTMGQMTFKLERSSGTIETTHPIGVQSTTCTKIDPLPVERNRF